jgi:hypothetical protein
MVDAAGTKAVEKRSPDASAALLQQSAFKSLI